MEGSDSFGAAAEGLAMDVESNAGEELEREKPPGEPALAPGQRSVSEPSQVDKEDISGDAATRDPEDARPKVSTHHFPPCSPPSAQPLALSGSHAAELPRVPVSQVTEDFLLRKAEGMFPEGAGARRPFKKEGAAAVLTNGLLEDASSAIDTLWKQRGYDPKKPDAIKARLGYALDKYEAGAWLALGAAHLPLLSPYEAWVIGKRIANILGTGGYSVGAKLAKLRKRGKTKASEIAALLQEEAPLNLKVDEQKRSRPAPSPLPEPPPPPAPPPPPPAPPPPSSEEAAAVADAAAKAMAAEGKEISPDERKFFEEIKCCKEAGRAIVAAIRLEFHIPSPPEEEGEEEGEESEEMAIWRAEVAAMSDPDSDEEEAADRATLEYKHAIRRLGKKYRKKIFCRENPLDTALLASEVETVPCACGEGRVRGWPWLLHPVARGFCIRQQCTLDSMRYEWIHASFGSDHSITGGGNHPVQLAWPAPEISYPNGLREPVQYWPTEFP